MLLACVVSPASTPVSQSPVESPEVTPQAVVTQAQVDRWVEVWQKRLALAEWRVQARIVRQSDLNPETLGNLKWTARDHSASIKVLDPRDYDMPADQIAADMERTVVHELVHLELSVLPRNGSRKVEEQVVNRMTEALLTLDHGDAWAARYAANVISPKIRRVAQAGDVAARVK